MIRGFGRIRSGCTFYFGQPRSKLSSRQMLAGCPASAVRGCRALTVSRLHKRHRCIASSVIHCGRGKRLDLTRCMADTRSENSQTLPELEQVLFVESGVGCDQHGQNATKAVVRACRNAIEFNSIPSVERLVPGGRNGLKLRIKIGTPFPETVDLTEVKKVFPYGQTFFEVVSGGLCCQSGIAIPELGDKNDDMLIAVAAVTVGY